MMKLAPLPAWPLILALAAPVLLGGCAGDSLILAEAWDGYPDGSQDTGQYSAQQPGSYGATEGMNVPALSNTHWRLAEIQESGGRISRPADPAKYTFSFGEDGIVLMKLNCNRARGPWAAQPHQMSPNSLAIGPLTRTHNFCEPPSLDDRVGRDMEHVRSYYLDGERLYLELMLDGGTYVLERIETYSDRPS